MYAVQGFLSRGIMVYTVWIRIRCLGHCMSFIMISLVHKRLFQCPVLLNLIPGLHC